MARSRSRNQKARALDNLQGKGFVACAVGIALLLVPLLAGNVPLVAAWATVVTGFGWLALALGVVLLVVHLLATLAPSKSVRSPEAGGTLGKPQRRNRKTKTASTERTEPKWAGASAPGASAAQEPAASGLAASLKQPSAWGADVFAIIEWRQFEAVCESLFSQAGLETLSESHGAEGGIDVWLHSHNAKGPVGVVRCNNWQGKAVGVKEMSEFCCVMASHQLPSGTYATTSTYTSDAQQFAKANGITTLDGEDLLKLVAARSPEEQQTLLRVAFDAEYWRPTCASCGLKMVERTPPNGGAHFWGCSSYPHCKLRLPMVANLQQLSLLIK